MPFAASYGMIHSAARCYWRSHDPFFQRTRCNAVSEEENPKTAPSPCDFVTLPEEEQATAIGNKHRKIGKDRTCGSGDTLAERQTHRETDVLNHNTSPALPRAK